MTWEHGRQLSSLQTEDNKVNYKYDSNGMRTQKSDNTGTTNYYHDSDKNLIGLTRGNNTLLFHHDSDNNVTAFSYNGTMYYYIKNLQGDVVKIIDHSGTEVANYVYDAWGNIQSETGEPNIRQLNPFRYRSYVYDEETGFYYLQSRYYDPFSGRFLNADVYNDTGTSVFGTNKYVYCDNNSINYIDNTGNKKTTITAPPKNSCEISIKNSNLHKKRDSVMNYYCGKRTSGNYEVYTYTRSFGSCYFQSEYYGLRKTEAQWNNYLKSNWGWLKVTGKIVNSVSELLTYCGNIKVSAISTLVNLITNNYVPSQEKYITNQLLYNSNRYGNKYLVFLQVINKKCNTYYNKKTKKYTGYCFESNTYYPY